MAEVKTVTLEKLYAERFRTGEQLQLFRLKDMDRFLCPDCSIMMKRILPSVYFCSHCGNLLSEELGNEGLNFSDTYHLTNIREGLYTVRIAPIETKQSIDIHHDHEVKLKKALKRTKAWLEKRKGKTIQVTEEQEVEVPQGSTIKKESWFEEDGKGRDVFVETKEIIPPNTNPTRKTDGSSGARESEG